MNPVILRQDVSLTLLEPRYSTELTSVVPHIRAVFGTSCFSVCVCVTQA